MISQGTRQLDALDCVIQSLVTSLRWGRCFGRYPHFLRNLKVTLAWLQVVSCKDTIDVRKAKDTYPVKLKLNFLDVGASGCCRIFLRMVSMFSSVILTIANDVDIYSSSMRFYSLYCLFFSAASYSIYSGVLITSCSSLS